MYMHTIKSYMTLCIFFIVAIVEAKSGLKFEVNLKEATADGPKRPISPPKERPLSQEIIDKKLKDAEERRLVWD